MTHACPACGGLVELADSGDVMCGSCGVVAGGSLSAPRLACQVCDSKERSAASSPTEHDDNPIPWRGP